MASRRLPSTDDEIRAHTVGDLKPLTAPILIADYDPQWPPIFEKEAFSIRSVLGAAALRIEHVGSTSVPGLAAKPIIDMLLIVADSADESSYLAALENAGYRLRIREPEWHQHRLFKGPRVDINLHVFSAGCPEIDRMLIFRDGLRNNHSDRELYERTKRELANKKWKYTQNYADAKNEIVDEILERALNSKRKAD